MKAKPISFIALNLLTLAIAWLAGCSSTESRRLKSEPLPPPPARSIVLLQLTASLDGKPTDPFGDMTKVGFNIADTETRQLPKIVRPVLVRDVSFAKAGWVYLLMSPGDYRVTVVPLNRKHEAYSSLPYRLFVPVGRPLLYAGSLRANKHSQISLNFEPDAAQAIAQSEFKASGSLTLAPLQPVNAFACNRPLSQLGDIVVVTSSSEKLEQSHHFIGPAVVDYVNAAITPGAPGGIGVAIFAYDLAALPIAALAGTIAGTVSHKQWAAFGAGLGQEFEACHPETELGTAIFDQLQRNNVECVRMPEAGKVLPALGTTNAGFHLLRGDIREIRLVQGGKRGLVGTEATLRFRILDVQGGNCLHDQEFSVKSEFRNKKEYRGTPGQALFRTQLSGLINSGVGQFFNYVIRPPTPENELELPTKP